VVNDKLEVVEHLDKSCEWMVKPVDVEHIKIFNANRKNSYSNMIKLFLLNGNFYLQGNLFLLSIRSWKMSRST
jgi:hypothetical protein